VRGKTRHRCGSLGSSREEVKLIVAVAVVVIVSAKAEEGKKMNEVLRQHKNTFCSVSWRWKSIYGLFRIYIHRLVALSFPSHPISLPDSSKHSDTRLESQASRTTTFELKSA
jgi:hypothetical protein